MTCAKCGSEIVATIYYPKDYHRNMFLGLTWPYAGQLERSLGNEILKRDEFLERKCQCGFTWQTPCLDTEKK